MTTRYHPYNRDSHYNSTKPQWDDKRYNGGQNSNHRGQGSQTGPYRRSYNHNSPNYGRDNNYKSRDTPNRQSSRTNSYSSKSSYYSHQGDKDSYQRHGYATSGQSSGYNNSRDGLNSNLSNSNGSGGRAHIKIVKRPLINIQELKDENTTPAMKTIARSHSRAINQLDRAEQELLHLHKIRLATREKLQAVNLKIVDQDYHATSALLRYQQICQDRLQLGVITQDLENGKPFPEPKWTFDKKPTTLPAIPDPPPKPAQPPQSAKDSPSSKDKDSRDYRDKDYDKYKESSSRDHKRSRDSYDRKSSSSYDDYGDRSHDRKYDKRSRDYRDRDRDRDRYSRDRHDKYNDRDSRDYRRDKDYRDRRSRDRDSRH